MISPPATQQFNSTNKLWTYAFAKTYAAKLQSTGNCDQQIKEKNVAYVSTYTEQTTVSTHIDIININHDPLQFHTEIQYL
jgi:hypothetical protein